jgi:hypothetical protein
MKNFTLCIIASIVCRLLGLVAVLGFVFHMVLFTGNLHCLWLLFLLLAVELVPTYEFKHKTSDDEDTKEKNNGN